MRKIEVLTHLSIAHSYLVALSNRHPQRAYQSEIHKLFDIIKQHEVGYEDRLNKVIHKYATRCRSQLEKLDADVRNIWNFILDNLIACYTAWEIIPTYKHECEVLKGIINRLSYFWRSGFDEDNFDRASQVTDGVREKIF